MDRLPFSSGNVAKCFLLCFAITMAPLVVSGQFTDHETTSYSSRLDGFDPVKLSTDQRVTGVVKFIATNETYYPFTLKISFRKMENFTVAYRSKEVIVTYGTHNLFDLKVADPESGYSLDYDVSYAIGRPGKEPVTDYIYLVPLKPGSMPVEGKQGDKGIINSFLLQAGDTVYCCRKGIVVALPGDARASFRLSGKNALEILHDDGTIMIYNGLSGGAINLTSGMTVYPGDPLVVVPVTTTLVLHLVPLAASGQLPLLPILYPSDESTGAQYSRIVGRSEVIHPESIIIREMTPREIKQRVKNEGKKLK
jgi:hypothetical protein